MVQAISNLRASPVTAMAFRCWRERALGLSRQRKVLTRCLGSWSRRSIASAFRAWRLSVFFARRVAILLRVVERWQVRWGHVSLLELGLCC